MAGVKTSIIGRPRPSPRHRRAHPRPAHHYTLICEEPPNLLRPFQAFRLNLPQTRATFLGTVLLGIIDYRTLVLATGVLVLLSLLLMPRRATQQTATPEPAPRHTVKE